MGRRFPRGFKNAKKGENAVAGFPTRLPPEKGFDNYPRFVVGAFLPEVPRAFRLAGPGLTRRRAAGRGLGSAGEG